MSLINQVLREVDQRQGAAPVDAPTAATPTGAAVPRARRRALLVAGLVGLIGAALAGWWLTEQRGDSPGLARTEPEPALIEAEPELQTISTAAAQAAPARSLAVADPAARVDPAPSDPVPADPLPTDPMPSTIEDQTARPAEHTENAAANRPAVAAAAPEVDSASQAEQQASMESTPVQPPAAPAAQSMAASPAVPGAPAQPQESTTRPAQAGAGQTGSEPPDSGHISIRRADRPAHAVDPFEEAQRALARGQSGLAEERLRELLASQPGHVEARRLLATLLIAGGRATAAREVLQQGLEQASTPALAGLLARLLVEQDQLDQALAVMQAHAPEQVTDIDYHLLHAALLRQAGRHAEALAHYQSLAQVAPTSAAAWVGLGASHEALDEPEAARAAYQQAVRMDQPELAAFARSRLRALQ